MTPSQPSFLMRLLMTLRYFYLAMTGAYALSVLLFLTGRVLIGEQWLLIAFFNSVAHLLWMPSLVLLPITLVIREWRVALMLLPTVLMFLFIYTPHFIPDNPTVPADATTLTLMTHNIYGGNRNIEGVVDNIRAANAGLVALQEVYYPMAEAIASDLLDLYPYQALHPHESLVVGMGFLSKYPIEEDEFWRYDWVPTPLAHQRIQVQVNDEQSIVVYNVHPTHPGMNGSFFNPAWRSREIADLISRVENERLPVVMLGDFNMPHLSDDYALITNAFEDTYRSVGWGMGWTFVIYPMPFGILRLDYIFVDDHFTPLASHVMESSLGSDHLPMVSTVALKAP